MRRRPTPPPTDRSRALFDPARRLSVTVFAQMALLAAALVSGCGPTPPPLPPPIALAPSGPGVAGRAPLADRGFARSGYACLDCHRLDAPTVRPAPPLAGFAPPGWRGRAPTTAAAVVRCVERYQRRIAPAEAVADLVAAIEAAPPAPDPPLPAEPAALYDAACRHCHEGGPAGPVLGRPHRAAALRALIRGDDRPRHPGTSMPPYTPEALPDVALDALVEWLTTTGYTADR